jgi:hypothetical protein
MSTFLESLMTEKSNLLSTLDAKVQQKLAHLDALISIEQQSAQDPPGGITPPTPPDVP